MSPHLHCRFELLAPLGNPTEKKCSNLLIGVENTAGDVCCEDQCEICGGKGCGQRPGGSVRWCLDIFVSCPLVSRALANDDVLFVRDLGNGGKAAGTETPTKRLATVSPQNVH